MSFLVSDTQLQRHTKIRSFLDEGEWFIAVLLSAADFEWTARRGILALGHRPTVDIRQGTLATCTGIDRYKEAWKLEVKPTRGHGLPEVIPEWERFRRAFQLRHTLVHGIRGTAEQSYAAERAERILQASQAICTYAQIHTVDLYQRLPVRRRLRGNL